MSINNIVQAEALVAGGGTITITSGDSASLLKLTGAATLVAPYNVVSSGTFSDGDTVITFYNAVMDFSGNSVTILGKVVPAYLEALDFVAYSVYNGVSWETFLLVDTTQAASVNGASIGGSALNGALLTAGSVLQAAMETLTRGNVLVGNAGGVPTPLDAKTNTYLLIGDGTDLNSVVMSGDIAIDNAGVTTIQPGSVDEAMLSFGVGGELRAIEVILTHAQIQALNSSPIEILSDAAVGAGNIVDLIRVAIIYDYNTAAYVFGGDAQLQYNDGTAILNIDQADVQSAVDKAWVEPGSVEYTMIADRGVRIQALVSDPTGGNAASTMKIRIYYTLMSVT